jgi:hypothetical protein
MIKEFYVNLVVIFGIIGEFFPHLSLLSIVVGYCTNYRLSFHPKQNV